jgi:hypothetical protein
MLPNYFRFSKKRARLVTLIFLVDMVYSFSGIMCS